MRNQEGGGVVVVVVEISSLDGFKSSGGGRGSILRLRGPLLLANLASTLAKNEGRRLTKTTGPDVFTSKARVTNYCF
jgi:hypothetical protein